MKENEKILILDFGGQYNQLIARRVRECNVYSEVVPFNISLKKIKEINPKGIIFYRWTRKCIWRRLSKM